MAKNKTVMPSQKPQNPEKVNTLNQIYDQVTDHDKGVFLRRAGVFYLQSWWRPVSPPPELRPALNQLGRLALLINTVMTHFKNRRLDIEDMEVVSIKRIRDKVVRPIVKIIQDYCKEIEDVLQKVENPRGSQKGGKAQSNKDTKAQSSNKKAQSNPDIEEEREEELETADMES